MIDEEDELDPFAARRVIRASLLACAGFAAVTVWTVLAAPGKTMRPPPAPLAAPPVEEETKAPPATAPPQQVVLAVGQRTAEVAPARRIPGLLGLQLGYFRSNDLMGTIALD